MSVIPITLVLLIAFLVGIGGILDEFQSHQPLVACTLIGLVTGNLEAKIVLGGILQMIVLGWANIKVTVTPDAALVSTASAIILVLGGQGVKSAPSAITIAVSLAVVGLFLAVIIRAIAVPIVRMMDAIAEKDSIKQAEVLHIFAIYLRDIRIAIPTGALLSVPAGTIRSFLELMPAWLTDDMAIGGGMVAAVGYAPVINMMVTREVWSFLIVGFVVATISQLTLIVLGALDVALALTYLNLPEMGNFFNSNGGSNPDDPLGDILDDC